MPSRKRTSPTTVHLPQGCVFPPEIISRICSFYVEAFNKCHTRKILPLLMVCKAVSQTVIPMLYKGVHIRNFGQMLKFLDPSITPSSHFTFIHHMLLDFPDPGSPPVEEIQELAKTRGQSLMDLPHAGRFLRKGRGRMGQPRKLRNLQSLDIGLFARELGCNFITLFEAKNARSDISDEPVEFLVPWATSALDGNHEIIRFYDFLTYQFLDWYGVGYDFTNDQDGIKSWTYMVVHITGTKFLDCEDNWPYDLGNWDPTEEEVEDGERIHVSIWNPDKNVVKLAEKWEGERLGVVLDIRRG